MTRVTTLSMPAGPTTTLILVMPLPYCAEGSAKAKPELGPTVSSAFLYTSVLTTGVEVS